LRRKSKIKGAGIACPECGGPAQRKYTDPTKARCQKCFHEFDIYVKK